MNISATQAVARWRFSLTSEETFRSELFSLAAVAAFLAIMTYVIARAA
jgi:hypothetical protein